MITGSFNEAFKHVIGIEGKYANDPRDSGGETMYGVTKRVALAHGYTGAMRELPLATAQAIAKRSYWDVLRLDDIAEVSPKLAQELFDSCFNVGATRAGSWFQAALNGLNLQASVWKDIPIDGQVGAITIAAWKALIKHRGAQGAVAVGRLVDCQQGAFYLSLSQSRPKDEAFLFGWIMNRTGGW